MIRLFSAFLLAFLLPSVAVAGLLDRLPFGKDTRVAAEIDRNDARLAVNAAAWPLLSNPALLDRCDGGRAAYGFARLGIDGIKADGKPAYDEFGVVPREVMAVYAGSPAAAAGLRAGDVITRVNGTSVRDSHRGDNKLSALLDDARDEGAPITLDVERGSEALALTITPVMACDFEAIIGGSLGLAGSHALPRNLRNRALTVDIAVYRLLAEDQGALQAVVVHELAHQFAGHVRARALASGVGRGLDVALGAVAGISTGGALGLAGGISFKDVEEREADALALDLSAALGLDREVYPQLVRRLAAERPDLLASFVGAHPVDSERLAALPAGTEG